ncbi:unnamed protein product [Pseudo-nitzschia multistriata]|uniref:Uncharacterized protein n=1 Tax=Pseudo-nitzschia multistriata TaxID=183589 RepID=A0A448Z2M8_9STRA|nr:unnamed protein product [Pseudo-nitzschia multistriata]
MVRKRPREFCFFEPHFRQIFFALPFVYMFAIVLKEKIIFVKMLESTLVARESVGSSEPRLAFDADETSKPTRKEEATSSLSEEEKREEPGSGLSPNATGAAAQRARNVTKEN